MRHVHQKNGAHVLGDFGKAGKVDTQRISRSAGDDQFGFGFVRLAFHVVVVNFFFGVQAIADHLEPFAAHVQRHAVRQVTTFGQTHAHDGVTGLEEGQKHGHVGRGAAMRLHVGGIGTKNQLDAVNRQLLGHVHMLATTVIAAARVAFGVFVGELRALRGHDGGRGIVFAGDQLNVVLLAGVFSLDGSPEFGVGLLNQMVAVVHGSP